MVAEPVIASKSADSPEWMSGRRRGPGSRVDRCHSMPAQGQAVQNDFPAPTVGPVAARVVRGRLDLALLRANHAVKCVSDRECVDPSLTVRASSSRLRIPTGCEARSALPCPRADKSHVNAGRQERDGTHLQYAARPSLGKVWRKTQPPRLRVSLRSTSRSTYFHSAEARHSASNSSNAGASWDSYSNQVTTSNWLLRSRGCCQR